MTYKEYICIRSNTFQAYDSVIPVIQCLYYFLQVQMEQAMNQLRMATINLQRMIGAMATKVSELEKLANQNKELTRMLTYFETFFGVLYSEVRNKMILKLLLYTVSIVKEESAEIEKKLDQNSAQWIHDRKE